MQSRQLFWVVLFILVAGCYTTVKPPKGSNPTVDTEERSAKPSIAPPVTPAPAQKPVASTPTKIPTPPISLLFAQDRLTPEEKQALTLAEFQVDFAQKTATLRPILRVPSRTGPSVQSTRAPAATDFIKINTGNFQFDLQNGIFSFDATLTNTSPNTIVSAPLRAVIDRLRPAPPAINVSNADGGGRGNGAFFEYSGFAGGDQQLAPGETSVPRNWQFFNPQMRLFSFIVRIDGQIGGNSPPVLSAIGNRAVDLGRALSFKLSAADPNPKDSLAFSIAPLPAPANASLNAMTGVFTFKPKADQVGETKLTFMVSDGKLQDSEEVTITVRRPPGGVTAVNGLVLDTNDFVRGVETPVIGAVVSLLGSNRTATSDQNGNFSLSNIPAGHQIFDLDVTNARPAPDGSPYSGFREEVDLIEGVTNYIERPFFLPRLARESLTPVNPNVTTVVNNPTLQTTMTVPPNTAKMGSANFTGMLSISPVPEGLAPAALPEALRPGMLITIQPVGVTFATPVPITFPNTDNLPPGTETDIWSLDAGTGVFVVVGTGRVSDDGRSINTISGGIRAADWHMTLPPSGSPDDRGNNNDNQDQDKCTDCDTGSQTAVSAGNLNLDHTLASYRSLGQSRALRLVYNSTHADPRPIVGTLNTISRRAAVPLSISTQLQVAGVNQGAELFMNTRSLNESVDEVVRQAVQFDASQFATGLYPYRLALASHYPRSSVSGSSIGTVLVKNEQKSPFGAGWTLDGLSRLHFAPDGNVILSEGDGSTRVYSFERLLFAGNFNGGTITRINLNTLAATTIVTGLTQPEDGAVGADGRIYFAESLSRRITRFNLDGTEPTPMNTGGQSAEGLVFDRAGNLYFNTRGSTSPGHTGVWRIDVTPQQNFPDPAKAPVRVVAPFSTFGEGTAIAIDGDILAAASAEGRLVRFDQATQTLNANFITGLRTPAGVAVDKDGNIYVAEANGGAVKKYADSGVLRGEVATGLLSPLFLEVDNAGTIYVAEQTGNRIAVIDAQGRQTQIPLSFPPAGLALYAPSPGATAFRYKSPAGDFSTLERKDDGTFTLKHKDGTQVFFNANGLQTSVVDRNGNTTKYEYNANDRLIKITDPVNLVTALAYTNGLLAQITDPANRSTRFAHDAGDNLIRITDPDNTNAQFGYDAQHRLTTQISKRGFSTTYAYDFAGRNVKVTRPDGSINEMAYSEATGLIDPASGMGTKDNPAPVVRPEAVVASFKDGNGYLTRFKTDRFGASTETVDPLGRRTIITRDENGNPTRVVSPNGAVTRLSYDSRGNLLTSIINPSGFSRLNCGQLLTGDIADVGEQDSLTFEANRNDAVYITLAELQERDAGFDVRADLISPTGAVVLRAFNSRRFFNNLPAAGMYVIRIYDNANLRRGSYALRLDCIAPPTPNSRLLACGQTAADTIAGAVDSDLFIFNAQAGNIVSLTFTETADIDAGFDGRYDLYSPTGVSLAGSALGRRQFTLTETGPHVVKIFDNSNLRRGAYALGLECITPPSLNIKPLVCGQTVRDTIAAVVDADLFTFTAQPGNVVSITLASTQAFDASFDARYDLFSPTGQQLAAAASSRLQFTLAAAGAYVIKVFDNANIRRGSYALGLECIVPPSTNAKPIACGQIVADTIAATVDADLFTFTAQQGNVVSITLATTQAFDANFDARYDLFSPTGQLLAGSASSRQQYTLAASGTYAIKVFDNANIRRGAYALGLECIVPPSANAKPIACGQIVADTIAAVVDADLFTFTAQQGNVISIMLATTQAIDTGFDARYDLFSPTGQLLAGSATSRLQYTLAATGRYVIKVFDNANIRRGLYALGLECIVPPSTNAKPLVCGQLVADTIATATDSDLFTFAAQPGNVVSITLTSTQSFDANFDARYDLFSPTGQLIIGPTNGRRQFTLSAAGLYVVKVFDNANLRRGAYALGLECIVPPSETLPMSCGQVLVDSINAVSDADLYAFPVKQNDVVSITLAPLRSFDAGFDARYDLFSPTGQQLAASATSRQQYTFTVAGAAVIKVFDNNNTRRGSYAVGLECIVPPSADADALICGQLKANPISAAAEADLYKFTAQAGHIVAITLAQTQSIDAGFDVRFDLFSPTGQILSPAATNSRRQFTLTTAGTYLIRVFDVNNTRRGAYALGFECLVPPSADALALACGQVIADSINAASDADLYTFAAQQGNVIALTLALTRSFDTGFDARYDLFSPTGQQLATSATSRQQYTLNATGTYVLRVFDINNIRRGAYSLGFECLVPPSSDAQLLACGQTLGDSIYAAAEADLFAFASEANKSFTITLTETRDIDAGFVARADLFSPTGAVVVSNFIGARNVTLAAAGTYVLRVYDNANLRRGAYTLGLQCLNLVEEITSLKIETEEDTELSPTLNPVRPSLPAIFVPVVVETTPSVADTSAFPIKTAFTYEPVFNQITAIVDPKGDTTKISYDAKGNPIQIIDVLNHQTALAYNAQGLLSSITDALSNKTAFEYDVQGNLIKTTDALGNATALTYDAAGNVNTSRDAEGRTTQFGYDAMNRLIRVTDALGGVTGYAYDPEGNLLEVRDAKGNLTSFEYDTRNRLSATIDPLGQDESFTYDGNGNLLSTLDRNLQTIAFQYDAVNQLIRKTLPGNQVTTFAHDDVGNLTRVDDPDSKLGLAYDAANRLISVSTTGSPNQPDVTLTYVYDASGNRRRMIDSQTGATNYTYDALNRLTAITNPAQQTVSFEYDALSRRTKTVFPNGVTTTYAYDALSQLTNLAHTLGASTISSFGYAYDKVGNRTTLNTTRSGVNVTPRLNYTYDALNRLIQATYPLPSQPNETFNYDAVGNRLRRDGQTADAAFDSTNRLLQDVQFTYRYDNNGNLIQKTEKATGKITRYTFDAENQLIQIQEFPNASSPASKTVTYRYDGLGRRIEKNVDAVVTRFVYDNEDILLEFDGGNSFSARYTHGSGIDEPFIMERARQSFFYHVDGLGSTVALTNSSGAVERVYAYDSFGRFAQQQGSLSLTNPYTYTRREYDIESDLHYYRARYYFSGTGRFLQEDPLGHFGGVNFYTYVLNDPHNRTDASGLVLDTFIDIGFILYDLAELLDGCDTATDLLALGADIGGAFIPFATGGGAGVRAARLARNAARGAEAERAIGRALGLSKNTRKFPTSFGDRIPDFVTSDAIHEVKAVKNLSNTKQLRGFMEIAQQSGRKLIIHVRQDTILSGPIRELEQNGIIQIIRDVQ